MFNTFGFFKEYYINNKFIGSIKCEKDRDAFGFFGKKYEILTQDIKLSNNRIIKKGTNVETMLFNFCGKIK